MAHRKNRKRFDPRYFLHERIDVDSLAQQVADEPELENQLRAMPQEFDEKTSKPQFTDKLELVRSFVLQTEPFASGEAGFVPGEAEAVAKRALQLVFDRTAKFETLNRGVDLEEGFRLATYEDWEALPPVERILRRIRDDGMDGTKVGDLARRLEKHHDEGGDITKNYHTQPGQRWGDDADGGAGKQIYTI